MALSEALTFLKAHSRHGGLMALSFVLSGGVFGAEPSARSYMGRDAARAAYAKLPLTFERNDGQTDPEVRFLARAAAYTVFLTPTEAVVQLNRVSAPCPQPCLGGPGREASAPVVRMKVVGANPDAVVGGDERLSGRVNYLMGRDAAKWQTNVPTFARVSYRDVYPGIDLVYYGNQGQLEYDFIVDAGRDPSRIRLELQGARRVAVDPQGDLIVAFDGGQLRWHRPVSYQQIDGEQRSVDSRYLLFDNGVNRTSAAVDGDHTVTLGFELGAYDRTQPLVIDPRIVYSTYLGGLSEDVASGIVVDRHGHAFVSGITFSPDFPTTKRAFQRLPSPLAVVLSDAFVVKMKADGSGFEYATYLGGQGDDFGLKIAVADHDHGHGDEAYITGATNSVDFPTTPGVFQRIYGGGVFDAFVTKLSADGSTLIYSTYLGTLENENLEGESGIRVDDDEQAYVMGSTDSPAFPTTPGVYQPFNRGTNDAFITKFDRRGRTLIYSTYLGGSSYDVPLAIDIDPIGQVFVTGMTPSPDFPTTAGAFQPLMPGASSAFVTKFNRRATGLVYSTYLGGLLADSGTGIAVDDEGNAFVTGNATSPNFPTTRQAFQRVRRGPADAFVTKLNRQGTALIYSTLLGGTDSDTVEGIDIDRHGHAHLGGTTGSLDFPLRHPFQRVYGGGDSDAFVAKFNRNGSNLVYSSYLGGLESDGSNGKAIAVDRAGDAYVVGFTDSPNFPTTRRAAQSTPQGGRDGFLTKVGDPGHRHDHGDCDRHDGRNHDRDDDCDHHHGHGHDDHDDDCDRHDGHDHHNGHGRGHDDRDDHRDRNRR